MRMRARSLLVIAVVLKGSGKPTLGQGETPTVCAYEVLKPNLLLAQETSSFQ